jgi:hypothetical protein
MSYHYGEVGERASYVTGAQVREDGGAISGL